MKKFEQSLLGLAFLGFIFVMGGWLYSRTAVFRLSEISIVSEDPEIEKKAQERLISYLGRSLFSVSAPQIQKDLSEISRIKNVTLTRVWPQTMRIQLELKKAHAKMKKDNQEYSVDPQGELIEPLLSQSGLIELRGFYNSDHNKWVLSSTQKKEFFEFLDRRLKDDDSLIDFTRAHFAEWSSLDGLKIQWGEPILEIVLGFEEFDQAWERAKIAIREVRNKKLNIESLDATYQNRVVGRTRRELQNSEYRLNLEELVRRTEVSSQPSVR